MSQKHNITTISQTI